MFRSISKGPADPVFILSSKVKADRSLLKIDLGVGVYRNEQGTYNELGVLKKAKEILTGAEPGHDYEVTTGDAEFVKNACSVLFGLESEPVKAGRIASVQAISGTGSIHVAALFLSRAEEFKGKKVYVGTPAWGNYEPLFTTLSVLRSSSIATTMQRGETSHLGIFSTP